MVIEKTIKIRMEKTDKTIGHMPAPLNAVQYRTAINEVKKTQHMLADFLSGSRKEGFRPENLHDLQTDQVRRLETLANRHNEIADYKISIREL